MSQPVTTELYIIVTQRENETFEEWAKRCAVINNVAIPEEVGAELRRDKATKETTHVK